MEDNKKDGYGCLTTNSEYKYAGYLANPLQNGKGTQIYEVKTQQEGDKYGELKLNGEEINMKVNSKMDRDLVMKSIILEIDKLIKEIGKMEIDMEMET